MGPLPPIALRPWFFQPPSGRPPLPTTPFDAWRDQVIRELGRLLSKPHETDDPKVPANPAASGQSPPNPEPNPPTPNLPDPFLSPGREYEIRKGSQQTPVTIDHEGTQKSFRLDFPISDKGIVDLKDYDWPKQAYQIPFIQQQVIKDFTKQIENYRLMHPTVQFKFSKEPPSWVVEAIRKAGGSFVVEP
jgi:hypothetical protein